MAKIHKDSEMSLLQKGYALGLKKSEEKKRGERLLLEIRNNIIGGNVTIKGPFGERRITYSDYTASGRSLQFIEDFIQKSVLSYYANTHTESSYTGSLTSKFRNEAKDLIRNSIHCNEKDVVIFSGSGVTGAIDKLIGVLNLKIPKQLDKEFGFSSQIPKEKRPIVFVGPYEHHSNELSWVETIAEVIEIEADETGHPSYQELEKNLIKYKDRPLKIGSFSAASNVTGIMTDVGKFSSLLHKYGALAFWDYASAGPYVKIDMNEIDDTPQGKLKYKDAIFLSPHKFIGGPGTPGVLIAKKYLFTNSIPVVPGGGTVDYVASKTKYKYSDDIETREEGGTPAIVESIRAGLVFQLKDAVGTRLIQEKEEEHLLKAFSIWKKNRNIQILGNTDAWRLAIISFLIKKENRLLHFNFVVALLNDLFGIQSRGGCSCAGPYGTKLLKVSPQRIDEIISEIDKGKIGLKPGWTRLNFNYFISAATRDYLIEAVDFIAENGWMFLPLYKFDIKTSLWSINTTVWNYSVEDKPSLFNITYENGFFEVNQASYSVVPESSLQTCLDKAWKLCEKIERLVKKGELKEKENKIWIEAQVDISPDYWTPMDAYNRLKSGTMKKIKLMPILTNSCKNINELDKSVKKIDVDMTKGQKMKELFNQWDGEGRGILTFNQFVLKLGELGYTSSEAVEIFLSLDKDFTGSIDFEKFSRFIKTL